MQLNQWRIGRRLALGFGLLLAILGAMAALAAWQMGRLAANSTYYAKNLVPSYQVEHTVAMTLALRRRAELTHVLSPTLAAKEECEARIAKARGQVESDLQRYDHGLVSDEEDRRAIAQVRASLADYEATWAAVQALSREAVDDPAKVDAARDLLKGESLRRFNALLGHVEAWWGYNVKLSDGQRQSSEQTYREAWVSLVLLGTLALAFGVAAAVAITRSIVRPLDGAVALARRVAGGDLTSRVQPEGRDEVADLLQALQQMNDSLSIVVGQVRAGSDSIATGSTQIAMGNADLSQRTEEQASNLQQTTASMLQMNSTVQHSAETAREATTLAGAASAAARQGGEAVDRVVATMETIAGSSRKIADIIGTIDGIAFQTNILALNAAVEAARAGEQGRGFAVVAGEVRTLAQRSAEAAREIKSLIHASVENVDSGTRLVAAAGTSMHDIVQQVQRVSDLIAEIHSSASEQAAGIGQVNDAMSQLDQVTQQNAALVEESAAAAESLKQQAAQLEAAVGVFRVA
jgi:methyl-accepting chemotaxis protein